MICSRNTRISMRASRAPRHVCRPQENEIWSLAFSRRTSKRSPSGKWLESWLAEPSPMSSFAPSSSSTPPSVTAFVVTRRQVGTEESKRRISSTALGMSDGSSQIASHWSRWVRSARMPAAVAFDVVSWPGEERVEEDPAELVAAEHLLVARLLPGADEVAHEVLARLGDEAVDLLLREAPVLADRGGELDLLLVGGHAPAHRRQPRGAGLDLVDLVLRHAHEREGDLRRRVPDEVGDDVGLAAVDDAVDRLVDELAAARLERGDALGREGAAEDLPVTRVLGRVEVDERRPRVDAVLAHDLQRSGARRLDLHEGVRRGVRLGVVQHRHDVVPPRHDPVVEDRAVEDRLLRARAQHERVPRGGVARERVELAAEPGDRAVSRAHPRNLRPGVTARLACPLTRP